MKLLTEIGIFCLWILALGLTSYEARLYADKLESDFDQKFIEMLLKDKRLNN